MPGDCHALCTCVNLTKPAPRSPLVLWGYYWGNILPWDSLGLRPAIQSVRYAFAQAVRLSTVLWEFISEGKAKAEGHAKRTPVRLLLDQSLSITREDRSLAKRQGVCHGNAMGMPCIIIELRGIASQVLWNARVTAMQVLWEGYGIS